MTRATRIVIIGGGIGGLTAARAIAQRGFEVQVYESSPELKEIGAGVALAPNAMKVLRSIGLEDAVRAVGWQRDRQLTRHWKTDRIISTTDLKASAARYGTTGCTVHRADLLDVLAKDLPSNVAVTLGAKGMSVKTEGGVASARLSDGTEVEGDVVVGADGIHSAVRASLFGADSPRFTGKICYRCVIPLSAVDGDEDLRDRGTTLGPHGTIVVYGIRRGELINVVCHHDDETYKHESWITECSKEEVLECYRDWSEPLLRLFAAGEPWYKWALYDRDPIPQWTDGRVTLLGDSAHPMLPYLGQGACQALEDGAVLAAALEANADDVPGALQLYERIRRPRASRVVLTARARGVDNHLASPIAAWKRDVMINLRKRFSSGVDGRGDTWIPEYDASSPDVLVR